jgi:hypothetical protein
MAYSDAVRIDENTIGTDLTIRSDLRIMLKAFGEQAEVLFEPETRNEQAFRDKLIDLTRWMNACLRNADVPIRLMSGDRLLGVSGDLLLLRR